MEKKRYYGKYRGTVFQNADPLLKGRIMVEVPSVLGPTPSGWAEPCLPFAGPQAGFVVVPPLRSAVWVEFEAGDPEKPIWTGGFYGTPAEVPVLFNSAVPPVANVVIQTPLQNTLMISDVPGPTGGILLKSQTGALISITDVGITLSNGKGATIVMAGPSVTVNNGALVVT